MDTLVSLELFGGVVWNWVQESRLLMTTCSVLVALVSSVFLFSRFRKPLQLPPGPKGLPFVGNLLQLGSLPHKTVTELHKKYGHLVYLRLGSVQTIVMDSPELFREITREQDNVFSSRPHLTFTELVAYDAHDFAMAPYGPHWRHVRKICVHELLTNKRLESTAGERKEEWRCMVKAILEAANSGDVVDMRDVFAGVSMTVMCRMLVGRRDFSAREDKPRDFKHLIHELFRLMGVLNLRDFVPALGWLDLQGFERDMRKVCCSVR